MISMRNAVTALSIVLAMPLSNALGQQQSQSVALNNRQRFPLVIREGTIAAERSVCLQGGVATRFDVRAWQSDLQVSLLGPTGQTITAADLPLLGGFYWSGYRDEPWDENLIPFAWAPPVGASATTAWTAPTPSRTSPSGARLAGCNGSL